MTLAAAQHPDDTVSARAALLVDVYNRIHHERMNDMPLNNPDIRVDCIGLREYRDDFIGVLITPWCMNLVSLPGPKNDWGDKTELSEETVVFPSGSYTFTVGSETALGHFRSCSMFSPMFEFADHDAAIDTATAIMDALFDENHVDKGDISTAEIEAQWYAPATPDANTTETDEDTNNVHTEERPAQEEPTGPMSRRALFTGRRANGEDD